MDVSEHLCCICLESLDTVGLGRQSLPCGHVLHEVCVTEMRRRGSAERCPLCRESHDDLTPVQALIDQAIIHFIRKSYSECFMLASEAHGIDPEHVHANAILGELYHKGHGVRKDLDKSIEMYEEASYQGHIKATGNLAIAYEKKGNVKKAVHFYEVARRQGCGGATNNLGSLHELQGDVKKAEELYKEARNQGFEGASFSLGCLYEDQGDIQKAVHFYEEARQKGLAQATFNLGRLYQQQGNIKKMFELFEEAHCQGFAEATYNLGRIYEAQGNINEAINFYKESRCRGFAKATNNLTDRKSVV